MTLNNDNEEARRLERETRNRSVEHRLRKMRAIAKRCAAPMGPDGPGLPRHRRSAI